MHHINKKKRGTPGSDDQLESEDDPESPAVAIKDPPGRRTPHKPITELVVTQHAKSSPVLEEKPVTPSSSAKSTDHTTWISLPAPRTKLYSQQNRRLKHATLLGTSARRVSETACERLPMVVLGPSDKQTDDAAGAVDVDAASHPDVKLEDESLASAETQPEDEQEKERTTRREAIAFLKDEHRVRWAQNRLARRSAKWRRKLSGSPTLQALAREDELYLSTSGLSSAQEASFLRKLRWIKKFHPDTHRFVNEHPICLECEDTCTRTPDASCEECRRRHKACPRQKMYQIRQLCAWMDDITEDAAARALRVLGTARRKNSKALLGDGPRRRGKYQSARDPRRRRSWEIDLHLEMGWSIGGSDDEEADEEVEDGRNQFQHRGSRDRDEEPVIPVKRLVRGRTRDPASSDDDEEGPGGGGEDGADEMDVDDGELDPGCPARSEEGGEEMVLDGDELGRDRRVRNATKGTLNPNYTDDDSVNHSKGVSGRGSITQRSPSFAARLRHASVDSTTGEEDCPTIFRRHPRSSRQGSLSSKGDSNGLSTPCPSPCTRTTRPSCGEALSTRTVGDEADDMDMDAADPENPAYHGLKDAVPAGHDDEGGSAEDHENRSHDRSSSYISDSDDDLLIPAQHPRPCARMSESSSLNMARLGTTLGVEVKEAEETDTAKQGEATVRADQEQPDLAGEEDPAPAPAGYDTDEDHEDDRLAPASTCSTRAPTPRARCRGGSISSTEEEEEGDADDKDNSSTPRHSRSSSRSGICTTPSHEAQFQLPVPAPAFLADEPEEAADEAGANGAKEFLGDGFGQAVAEAEEAEAESDLWSTLGLELAYPEDPETTPGNGHVNVDGLVRRLPGWTSTSTATPSSITKRNRAGISVPAAAPSSSHSYTLFQRRTCSSDTDDDEDDGLSKQGDNSGLHPRPRPCLSPSPPPRLPTIGVSSFSSRLQLARSRTAGVDADGGSAGLGLGLEPERHQGEGGGKSGHDDRGNAIVYIDDTAMVVDREGLEGESESESESESEDEDEGEAGVDHARGSKCTSVGFSAVLDGDDNDVEAVEVEVDGKEGASGSAGPGHYEDEPEDENGGPPGARKRDAAPESKFEVVADDRGLNHTKDLSWDAGTGCADDDNAGTTWGSKLKGDVDVYPNASVVAANSCDEESDDDNSSEGDSSENDSAHEEHAQPAGTALILPPLQAPADEDHNHDGGREDEMDVDDLDPLEGNGIKVMVKNAKEDGGRGDGDGDIGSRGADNVEVEVERDCGRAAAGALVHADEFSGREGEHGEAINQKHNIEEDEAGDLDASNGFVDDGAGFGGRADYTYDDETAAEPPAEGDDENTVDNGGGSGDDKRVGDITAPDIDEEDSDSCSRNRGAEDPNLNKTPAKPSSTPNSDDEILRLRQALENEQKNSARLRLELKAQTKNHINLLARLGLRTSIVRRQEHHLRVDQQADTQNLRTALRALQDEIDREVEACMCGAQRELGSEDRDEYDFDFDDVELEKNRNGKRRLFNEDENQEEDGVDDLGEPQGSENFSVEDPPRSRFKRARIE